MLSAQGFCVKTAASGSFSCPRSGGAGYNTVVKGLKTVKISSLSSLILGSLAFLAGCAGTNRINIVQDYEGEHVLACAEFGEENPGFVSSVAMADSSVSTRIDLEHMPSSVVITDSRRGEEIVRWSGEKVFAWQYKPLGEGRTMRLTVTVRTPSRIPFIGSILPDTEEVWLAVLVNNLLVDLDEFLDDRAASDEGDSTERPATRRRPVRDDEGDDSEDEEPAARRPSRRNNDEDRRRVGSGGLGVRRRRRPEPEVPTTRRDLRDEEVEEEPLAAASTITLLE